MFKFQKVFSVSLNLYPVLKNSESSVGLLSRVLCNSGCLIAGCCFSKKSDEEELVSENKHETSYNKFPKNVVKKGKVYDCLKFDKHASRSDNMKRSYEFINDNTSQNFVEAQNVVQESVSKKKKTDFCEATDKKHTEIKKTVIKLAPHDSVIEPHTGYKEKFNTEEEKTKKLRPNYFVAVKISDDQIHQELKELQAHILQKDERLKKSMIELKTLHITLFVMHIGDPETHARAVETLENIHREYNEDMSKNPLLLKFQGLSHFQNRVLYAKLMADDSYNRLHQLAESVKRHYTSASIFSTDSRQDFTPHLTIAKIDFRKRQNRFIKKINPLLYKDFDNQYFGTQKVESIQLLSMLDPKTEAGYYSGKEFYFSAFEPSLRRDSLSKQLEIEEKKKNIKEKINAVMKEKLK